MSGLFDEGKVFGPQPPQRRSRAPRALIPTIAVLLALLVLGSTFTDIWTERLWFDAIDHSGVFNTMIGTRVLLFVVFGLLLSAIVLANVVIAYRTRPLHRMLSADQRSLDRYRDVVEPVRRLILIGLGIALFFFGGTSAASQWETFLLWRNGGDFGTSDEFFGIDIGFFVFDYPFLRYLIGFGFAIVVVSLVAVALTNYLYGGISLQAPTEKVSGTAQVHLSVLIGVFMLLRAGAYWMDRYGLAVDDGNLFTGVHFTDANAELPAKNILTVIAIICALLFFANVIARTWMLPVLSIGMLVLSAVLLGGLWPFIVQQFQVRPSEPDKEAPYIEQNIAATRAAYGVQDAEVDAYDAETSLSPAQLRDDAEALPGTRLLDPTLVSPAFEQLQQVRGFYRVPQTLDVDSYTLDGEQRDMVVGLRELDLSGLPADQRNWNNDHTVYTHGYGMIAAYGSRRNAEGEPVWADTGRPPSGEFGAYEPRVYYGELGPSYSIVGAPEGSEPVELELPAGETDEEDVRTTTYDGKGGVDVGGFFHQVLYALKFREANILLSGRVNEKSTIIYDREPRQRVEKVAPWLTVDGNPYPAVVDERIVWIVDGYTTANTYPQSTRVSLGEATSDSLTQTRAFAAQPDDDINYMRNSVKAVVDAYDGTVTLYAWDESDPVLQAWRKVFPDSIEDRDEIPTPLLEHLRYPEDLFKVQRQMLTRYHVTDAGDFYQGNDRWNVPEDPSDPGNSQPPFYLSVRMPDAEEAAFSLTTVFTPQNRENLAAMMAVNADATSDAYGTMQILQLPNDTQIPGPGQVANAFNSDSEIASQLLPFQRGGASASFGNLLTLPVGEGLLYVQPVYTQRASGEGNYPVLTYVLASFGDNVGYGATLSDALDRVLGEESGIDDDNPSTTPEPPPPTDEPTDEPSSEPTDEPTAPPAGASADELLAQAQQRFVEADQALRDGDLQEWSRLYEEGRALFEQGLQARGTPTSAPTPTEGSSG
ncbi:MAG TPA: UPF0182 family protein [Nocardioidaceae bacterium]|nr:UPF0182 family protein [Nocardioidaceae bacterium]